jgi:3-oxoacyl-[acyl-carrier-protein] synthase-3
MPVARIAGTGRHLPSRVVTNADLRAWMDTSDDWIVARTGIRERRWVEGDVGASDLAVPAARAAMEAAGVDSVDLVLFSTLSPDINFPGSGCLLQAKLGLGTVPAMDIRTQCTGFLYGLTTAEAFIRAGMARTVLVVGAEVHSTGLDLSDRGRDVSVLFGDGAGAAVVVASDDADGPRILDSLLHAEGTGAELLMLEAPASRRQPRIDAAMLEAGAHYPRMDGRGVYRHAVVRMPEVARALLARNGYTAADVDVLVAHQANRRINERVAEELGIPEARVVHTIEHWGNTTAASIPSALDLAVRDGRVKPGNLVLLVAFGAGLTWGATLVRW